MAGFLEHVVVGLHQCVVLFTDVTGLFQRVPEFFKIMF